ncbi:hypothetical protein C0J52_14251 [Blattella germanica]|nr:hypothetical protein C0J52_14251 [Blattella germanica]
MANKQGGCESVIDSTLQSEDSLPSTIKACNVRGRKSIGSRRSLCFDTLDNRCKQNEGKSSHMEAQLDENKLNSYEKYLENLNSEHISWKVLLAERKKYYKELSDKYKREAIILDKNSFENILTKEDMAFLENRPNYENIMTELNKLGKMAIIAKHEKHKTAQLNANVKKIVEQQAAEEEERILRYLTSLYM